MELDTEVTYEMLALEAGFERKGMTNCMCVAVDHETYDAAEKGDLTDEQTELVQLVPGRYFKIGEIGMPVFKQEPSTGPNDQELYLWFMGCAAQPSHNGWYISRFLTVDLTDHVPSGVLAWLPAKTVEDGIEMPTGRVHIPYWSKKPLNGVLCNTYVDWAGPLIMELDLLRPSGSASPPRADAPQYAEETPGHGSHEHGYQVPSSFNQFKTSHGDQTSGWMNRCKFLVRAYLNGDDKQLGEVTDELMKMSKFASIVGPTRH